MRRYSLYFAWIIACIATLGSLYFSEIKDQDPCSLCWYQRIALFPLVIILGIAAFKHFIGIAVYVLPQVILGALMSAYEVVVQQMPSSQPLAVCNLETKCTEKISIGLGPITLPMLSLLAMLLIIFFLILPYFRKKS